MKPTRIEELKQIPIDSILFEEDKAALEAFNALILLRNAWVGDWRPDWTSSSVKYTIVSTSNRIESGGASHVAHPLVFPNHALRDEFYYTFRDLIEQAKVFL